MGQRCCQVMVLDSMNLLNVDHPFGSEVYSSQHKDKYMLLKSSYENQLFRHVFPRPDGSVSSRALV